MEEVAQDNPKPIAPDVVAYNLFLQDFYPLLGQTARWQGFNYIVTDLLRRPAPIIVETGTLRQPGNWAGDGQSTRVWDWLARKHAALVLSCDINFEYCQTAAKLCPAVEVICADSITFLRGYLPPTISLLYLDAFDYTPGVEISSMMHHAGELAAVWDRLPKGALIAIDDCHSDNNGKHALVKQMLKCFGTAPELESYIHVWRKP